MLLFLFISRLQLLLPDHTENQKKAPSRTHTSQSVGRALKHRPLSRTWRLDYASTSRMRKFLPCIRWHFASASSSTLRKLALQSSWSHHLSFQDIWSQDFFPPCLSLWLLTPSAGSRGPGNRCALKRRPPSPHRSLQRFDPPYQVCLDLSPSNQLCLQRIHPPLQV